MTSIIDDFRDKVELQILKMSNNMKNLASESPFHVLGCLGIIVILNSIKNDGVAGLSELIPILGLDAFGNILHDLHNKTEDEIIKIVKEFRNETKSQLAILIDQTKIDEIYCRLNPSEKTWFKNTLNNELSNFLSTGLCKKLSKSTTEKNIKRYIKNKEKGHIYTDLNKFHELHEITEIDNRCIIMGNAGYGKTFLGMAFAEFLQKEFSFKKVLYINMEEVSSIDSLILDIKKHLLDDNTVFIFDNCRDKFEIIHAYENRLGELVSSSQIHIVNIYISRISSLLVNINENEIIKEQNFFNPKEVYYIKNTRQIIKDIVKAQFPNLHSSNEAQIGYIYSLCGGDLFILNCILPEINSPNEVYEYNKEKIFEVIIARYFAKVKEYTIRSPIHKISAIARFDISPVARYFDIDSRVEKSKIFSDLVYLVDTRPPKFHFIHSSMAELVFQSLTFSEGIEDEDSIPIEFIVEYLEKLKKQKILFVETLIKLSSQDIRPLSPVEEQNLLLSKLLVENVVLDNIKENFSLYPLDFLQKILIFYQKHNLENYEIYYELIRVKILDNSVRGMLLSQTYLEKNIFIIEFKKLFPDLYSLLLNHLKENFDKFISEINSYYDLLMILILISNQIEKKLEEDFSNLGSPYFRNHVRNTIKNQIPNKHFTAILYKFKKINPSLQSSIEEKINPGEYISLACELGTMTELLNIINNSSPGMQKAIVTSLEAETIQKLINKTIDSQKSIGHLSFLLRSLSNNEETLETLETLENLIGADGYLRLILELGFIPDLFNIIKCSSQKMQKALVNSLDEETIQKLINKTIDSQKSISYLPVLIKSISYDFQLLVTLERLIGINGYLQLIRELDSIKIIIKLLETSSYSFKSDLTEKMLETFTINEWQKQFENLILKDYIQIIIKFKRTFISKCNFDDDFIKQMIENSLIKADIDEILGTYFAVRKLKNNDLKEIFLETTRDFIDNNSNEIISELEYEKILSLIHDFFYFFQERNEPKIGKLIEFLPPADILFRGGNVLKRVRYILVRIAKNNFAFDIEKEILIICNSTPVVNCIEKSSILETLLFLWNLYCVWEKHNPNNTDLFCGFLNHQIVNSVMESINKNIKEDSDEYVFTIALIGFLTYMKIAIPNDLRSNLEKSILLDQSLLRDFSKIRYLFNVLYFIGLENITNSTIKEHFWNDAHNKLRSYHNPTNPGLLKLSKYSNLRAGNIPSEP